MELSKPLIAERNIVKGSKYLWHIKHQLMSKIMLGLNDTQLQPLWVILCHLPKKWRKEIEELVEEMKNRGREERGR